MTQSVAEGIDLLQWQGTIAFLITFVGVALLAVYVTRQWRRAWESRAAVDRDDALRDLAAKSVAAQRAQADELAALRSELAAVKADTARIHELLRSVD
ncbi:uncharacterized membrane protein YcjF (UPF0283 family) [Streptosporangium becharense]|uniref:Uncharacterized membrane protein YcjF (UPF0283 family) n=1 Tax=Streptosporangium becharense TaxID=1816182 RepID=A0A7W9IL41_9ACTN|nr:hypothetical protein [Streptosporangium becharense]MBB2911847.1 uncharacterized membrane protein YcjF (UPF0283 family) [Streptosporangium becharense]MBB5822335.1 uncharacterized membrane protein YcjF (UPF0283 family) [Streptosporangium becharense]